jgi:hypothetical protein
MKRAIYPVLMLLLVSVPVWGQKSSCDRTCLENVKTIIKDSSYSKGYPSSWIKKANLRLGDSVAIALRKIYRGHQLYAPKNIREFLPVIKMSFCSPDDISNSQDKNPSRTLSLLREIKAKTNKVQLRNEISITEGFVKERVKSKDQKANCW